MKLNRSAAFRSLLIIAPALLLTLVLKPVVALAEDYEVTFVVADNHGYLINKSGAPIGTTAEVDAPDGKIAYNAAPGLQAEKGYDPPDYSPTGRLDGYEPYWTADADVTCDGTCVPAGERSTSSYRGLGQTFSVTQDTTITIRFYHMARIWAIKSLNPYEADGLTVFAGEQSIKDINDRFLDVTCIDGYELDYWTADADVSTDTATFKQGDHISNEDAYKIVPTQGFHLTAHTKKVTGTATFTTDGHGTVTTPSEDVHLAESYEMSDDPTTKRLVGMVSACTNPTASASYEFDYWTSNVDVYSLSSGLLTAIPRDTPLTTEEVNSYYIDQDTTFTAHFKQTGPIPEPDPVDPDEGGDESGDADGSDTIKPADDTTGKLTPKTGDTLPGVTAAVALGAGAIVAGAALLRKRHQ